MQIKPQIVQAIISVRNFPSHEEPYLYNSITYPHGYSLACTISCTTHHGLEQSRLRRECVHYHYTVVRIRENSSTSKLRPPTLPEVGRRYSYAEDGAVLLHHDIRCLAVPVAPTQEVYPYRRFAPSPQPNASSVRDCACALRHAHPCW
jgi:hypothetical protein